MLDLVQNLNFLKMGNPYDNPHDRPQLFGLKAFLDRYVRLYRRELGNLFSAVPDVDLDGFVVHPLRFVVEEERLVVRYHFRPYNDQWMEVEGQEMMLSCTTRGHEPDELYEGDEGTHVLSSCHSTDANCIRRNENGKWEPHVVVAWACINFYPENISQLLALLESSELREILEHESPLHAWLMMKYPETRGGE